MSKLSAAQSESITCPQCRFSFEPSAILRARLERELRKKVDGELAKALAQKDAEAEAALKAKEAELTKAAKTHAGLLAKTRELEEAARTQAVAMEQRIAAEIARVRTKTEQELRERLGREAKVAVDAKEAELADARTKLAAAAKAQGDVLRRARELEEREQSLKLEIERTLEKERAAVRARIEQEMRERVSVESAEQLRTKELELADARTRLANAAKVEIDLVKRAGELEDAQRRAAAETERRVQDEARKLRESLEKEATMQRALIEAEHGQKIEQANATIQQLQARLKQGSQQTQGEAQEIVLAELLQRAFARDNIDDVGKGERGADLLHAVRDDRGLDAGTILWESKRTKSWSDAWLAKARDDQRAAGAAHVVIVTQTMPAGIAHFGERSGVWICSATFAVALAEVLRTSVIELADAMRAAEGRTEKIQLLYTYLTGPDFKARIRGALEAFAEMQSELLREQRATHTAWKRRDQQMKRALLNLTSFYGDIRGIAGKQIEAIEAFELDADDVPALTEGERDSGELDTRLVDLLFELVPPGESIGNGTLCEAFVDAARVRLGLVVDDVSYRRCKAVLVDDGRLEKGRGRGGSVRRTASDAAAEE